MDTVNYQFMLSIEIIVIGYVLKRLGVLKLEDGEAASRLILNVTLPAVILKTFSSMKYDNSLLLFPVLNIVYGIFMLLLAIFLLRKYKREEKGMLAMLMPGFNIGIFAYPFIEAILGEKGLQYIAMFDMGNAINMFVITYLIAMHYSSHHQNGDVKYIIKKIFTSIPLMTYIITLILNIFGFTFPKELIDFSTIIASANRPLAFLTLGIFLSFSFELRYWKDMLKIIGIRYFVGAIVGILLYKYLPFDHLYKLVLLIGFILPVGLAVIPYSVQFNYDRKFVGTFCNLNNMISFIIMWLIFILL